MKNLEFSLVVFFCTNEMLKSIVSNVLSALICYSLFKFQNHLSASDFGEKGKKWLLYLMIILYPKIVVKIFESVLQFSK